MPKSRQQTAHSGPITDQVSPQFLTAVSRQLAKFESRLAGLILLAVFGIIMINVLTRVAGKPVIWADELAIYGMAWSAFVGASAALATRSHIAITLLVNRCGSGLRALFARAVDLCLFTLLVSFAIILWQWFDPITFLNAASAQDYAIASFNFMHQEPTTTLGIPKLWFWAILPVFNATALLHVTARLIGRADA